MNCWRWIDLLLSLTCLVVAATPGNPAEERILFGLFGLLLIPLAFINYKTKPRKKRSSAPNQNPILSADETADIIDTAMWHEMTSRNDELPLKPPWKMTDDELDQIIEDPDIFWWMITLDQIKRTTGVTAIDEDKNESGHPIKMHWFSVGTALFDGESIPYAVLKDYPTIKYDYAAEVALGLVFRFLDNSEHYEESVFTFTELFAFVHFELDHVLFCRKAAERNAFVQAMFRAYLGAIEEFSLENADYHKAMLDQRIRSYGEMTRSRKQKSDMVQKLDFYLNQTAGLEDSHYDDGSPVVVGSFFSKFTGTVELFSFYAETLAPFIERVIAVTNEKKV